MRQNLSRVRGRLLLLVGMALIGYPLASDLLATQGFGQGGGGQARPMINLPDNPALRGFRWREIGPVGQGARIDDYAFDEKNPYNFFIGFAVSGIFRTMNNGTTFAPIFETYGPGNIGDLALAPSDPNILYVGTGESNNRQSSCTATACGRARTRWRRTPPT